MNFIPFLSASGQARYPKVIHTLYAKECIQRRLLPFIARGALCSVHCIGLNTWPGDSLPHLLPHSLRLRQTHWPRGGSRLIEWGAQAADQISSLALELVYYTIPHSSIHFWSSIYDVCICTRGKRPIWTRESSGQKQMQTMGWGQKWLCGRHLSMPFDISSH